MTANLHPRLHLIRHPLVQHKLTLLRRRETATGEFRRLAREISLLMAYEVTRDLPLETRRIETPLEPMDAPILSGKKLCFVSILRAGDGILEGMLDLVPSARCLRTCATASRWSWTRCSPPATPPPRRWSA
jgi:uracil phosphoribosyltransferase